MVREIVEVVGELAAQRCIGMSEADIVGRDQVKAICDAPHQVAEHLAARWQTM